MILIAYLVSLLRFSSDFSDAADSGHEALTSFPVVWIFVISSWFNLDAVDRLAPRFLDGLVPFIPPVIPVVIVVAYFMRR